MFIIITLIILVMGIEKERLAKRRPSRIVLRIVSKRYREQTTRDDAHHKDNRYIKVNRTVMVLSLTRTDNYRSRCQIKNPSM